MARELPIHNGRMTTDLDANGFKIKNLPPGSGFTQAQADWNQEDATAPDFIKNKPTIPAAVTVDATLTHQGAAAEAKAVGDALRGGFTEWEFSGEEEDIPAVTELAMSYDAAEARWDLTATFDGHTTVLHKTGAPDDTGVTFDFLGAPFITATRHLITPTKTSQLTNDGDGTNAFVKTNDTRLSDARTPTAHTHAMADVTGLGTALDGKASLTDLPYALVEPGKWEFSDGLSHEISGPREVYDPGGAILGWVYQSSYNDVTYYSHHFETEALALATLEITFSHGDDSFTATRASLPGHLCDRAGNLVEVSGDTTLTLPAAVAGYLRDFLVRLEISGSTVPTITFSPNGNESVTYETDGDEFPVPDEAGSWLYSFTESCVAHKFAVSLKKVNEVAQAAQGGA